MESREEAEINESAIEIESKIRLRSEARKSRTNAFKYLAFSTLLLFGSVFQLKFSHIVVGFIALMMIGASAAVAFISDQKLKELTRQIIACDEVYALGALIELSEEAPWNDRSIKEALIRLLPMLTSKHINLLSVTQKETLYLKLLGSDARLVTAILKGLEQIGGSSSISVVQKLSIGKWSAEENMEVRETARRSLLKIQERVKQQSASKTLLRASSGPNEELLRASNSPTTSSKPNELLRPHEDSQNSRLI